MHRQSATYWLEQISRAESALEHCQPHNKQVWIKAVNYATRKLAEVAAKCGSMANAG